MTVATMRFLLILFCFAMYFIALLYLRRRPLSHRQFACWALFALAVPVLGPFLTIVARPPLRFPSRLAFLVRLRRKL